MSGCRINTILLVEDNAGDARLFREMLAEQGDPCTRLIHLETLGAAENYLAEHRVDVILLDLGCPTHEV